MQNLGDLFVLFCIKMYICAIKIRFMVTDIDLAREYIVMRASAEASYTGALGRYLDEAVAELVRIAYSYGVDGRRFFFGMTPDMESEVESVIQELLDNLYDDSRYLASAVADDGDDDTLLEWAEGLYEEPWGSYRDGFMFYLDMYRDEMESLIAASMLMGYSADEAVAAIMEVRKDPWHSSLWKDALILAGTYDVMATVLRSGGVSRGVGRSNVSFNLLDTYGRGFVSSAWMHQWKEDNGSAYFRSVIADNTACSECKAEDEKGWQPIDSYPDGGWHPNCRCAFVFADADDIDNG